MAVRSTYGFTGQSLIFQDDSYIGITSDTDLMQLKDQELVVNGQIKTNRLQFVDNELGEYVTDLDNGKFYINYRGYAGLYTRFRDYVVCDGKTNKIWHVIGQTKVTEVYGDIKIISDTAKSYYGVGSDASINYNGTNFIFDSQEVGTGNFLFENGNIQIDDDANIGCDSDTDLLQISSGILHINGAVQIDDDANIGCDSDTDLLQISSGILYVNGNVRIDDDANIGCDSDTDLLQISSGILHINGNVQINDNAYLGIDSDTDLLQLTDGVMIVSGFARAATTAYRRYYHMSLASFDPGAAGATWTSPGANTSGGWQLDAAGELLYSQVDVHSDWDAASDLTLVVKFQINAASNENDTVDLKAVFYYMGDAETSTKTQTVEVATNVGDGGAKAQYTQFSATFTIDYDYVSNVVEAGDIIGLILNLETDTSEVDDIIVNSVTYYYNTTHIGIESGDT